MEFFQRSLFQMLNLTPQRWKASAKVEQNTFATKHTTNFFLAKTKINPEMAKFDMWKWQNQREDGRKQAKKGKENSVRVRLFIAQNPRSPTPKYSMRRLKICSQRAEIGN